MAAADGRPYGQGGGAPQQTGAITVTIEELLATALSAERQRHLAERRLQREAQRARLRPREVLPAPLPYRLRRAHADRRRRAA